MTDPKPVDGGRCRCGSRREKPWHLVCPSCWSRIPKPLQDEVYAAYRASQGSARHYGAIRECFRYLDAQRANGGGA